MFPDHPDSEPKQQGEARLAETTSVPGATSSLSQAQVIGTGTVELLGPGHSPGVPMREGRSTAVTAGASRRYGKLEVNICCAHSPKRLLHVFLVDPFIWSDLQGKTLSQGTQIST